MPRTVEVGDIFFWKFFDGSCNINIVTNVNNDKGLIDSIYRPTGEEGLSFGWIPWQGLLKKILDYEEVVFLDESHEWNSSI